MTEKDNTPVVTFEDAFNASLKVLDDYIERTEGKRSDETERGRLQIAEHYRNKAHSMRTAKNTILENIKIFTKYPHLIKKYFPKPPEDK